METNLLILSVTMAGIVALFLLKKSNSKKTLEERMAESQRRSKKIMGCSGFPQGCNAKIKTQSAIENDLL